MDVRIKTLEPTEIITSFALGPYPESAPKAWDQLFAWLGQSSEISPKQLMGFGMDDPNCTPQHLIRYVAAMSYEGTAQKVPEKNIYPMQLKGGKYAIYTMKGPYQKMPEIFAKLKEEWLPSTQYQLDFYRPFLEIYLNDPTQTKEEDYLTDLHLPLL